MLRAFVIWITVFSCYCTSAPASEPIDDFFARDVTATPAGSATRKVQVIEQRIASPAEITEPELSVSTPVTARDSGGYPGDGPYVTIAYENRKDKGSLWTASRIALLAKTMLDTWRDLEYPELESVTEHFSNFHVIALDIEKGSSEPDADLARLRYPVLYENDPQSALDKVGSLSAWCAPTGDIRFVDVPEKANFFIVIKAWFLDESWGIETLLHEIVHPALLIGFGDSDSMHERGDIWLPRSGVDNGSFMAEVLSRFPM